MKDGRYDTGVRLLNTYFLHYRISGEWTRGEHQAHNLEPFQVHPLGQYDPAVGGSGSLSFGAGLTGVDLVKELLLVDPQALAGANLWEVFAIDPRSAWLFVESNYSTQPQPPTDVAVDSVAILRDGRALDHHDRGWT